MGNNSSGFGLPEKGKYGLKHEHRDLNDRKIKLYKKRSKLDNFSMKSSFPPIENQGEYATSVAHAISAILEFEQVKNGKEPIKISKLYLHALGKGRIRKTLQRIQYNGLVSEDDLPYNSLPPFPSVNELFYDNCLDFRVIPQRIEVVNSALYCGYPILIGMNIYNSFNRRELWNNDGVMPIPGEYIKRSKDEYEGSVGAVIVGYSSIKKSYEIRMSWGEYFKNDGYFYMPEELIENKYVTCSLWSLELNIPDNPKKKVLVETKEEKDLQVEPQKPTERKKFMLNSS